MLCNDSRYEKNRCGEFRCVEFKYGEFRRSTINVLIGVVVS